MSEETNPQQSDAAQNAQAGQQPTQAGLQIKRIYLKDLSFESPVSLEAFGKGLKPKIDQELNIQINAIEEDLYEVVLLMTITARADQRVVFLVEVKQAGLFAISGVQGGQLSQTINTFCPQILFPYAREVIDATLTRGSFPPLMLPPINFDAVFAQAVQQVGKQKGEAGPGEDS